MRLEKMPGRLLVLALSFALLMGGCSGSREKVVYLMHDDKAVFGSMIKEKFDRIAKSNNQPVEYKDAENKAELQIAQIEEAVRDGVKIVVISAVDEERLVPAVEKAIDAGVHVIAVNRHLRSKRVLGVFPDEYGAGKLQAEYMERNLPMGARVLYLQGPQTQLSAQERWEGFKERCLERREDIYLVDRKSGSYSREKGHRIMTQWLERYPHIDAVVCGNDEMALGAYAALKEAGRSRGCMVSGIDATEEALASIGANEMVQTVKQDAAHQAASAYQMVDAVQRGAEQQGNIISPFTSITKDNLAQFHK